MSDITDAGPRLKAMNDALEEIDRLRKREAELLAAGDRLESQLCEAARERDRLRGKLAWTERERDSLRVAIQNLAGQGGTLTDAERDAVEAILTDPDSAWLADNAATLRGLLERFSPIAKRESDSPQPIATPNPPSTPDECTVSPEWTSRPYYVDPPSGWRYGFPKLYDPAKDGDMRAWMIANGYPKKLANQGLPCTFTASTEDGEK